MTVYVIISILAACMGGVVWRLVGRRGPSRNRAAADRTARRLYAGYISEVETATRAHLFEEPDDEEWLAKIRERASAGEPKAAEAYDEPLIKDELDEVLEVCPKAMRDLPVNQEEPEAVNHRLYDRVALDEILLPQLDGDRENSAKVRTMLPYRPISPALAIAPTVSVLIPARNEAANLPHVFSTLPSWIDEIVLVDGHSVDDTVAVTRALCPKAKVIAQPGQGKGDALLAGFAAATSDIIVTIDADGSTDGAEIIGFVGALAAGADFAKGSRFSGSGHSDDITAVRRCGNRLLNILVNRMYRTQFTDLCYGYNAFWASHLDALKVNCAGFEVAALMNIRAAKAGLKIHEVPSHERCRIFGTSNLRTFQDGWRISR